MADPGFVILGGGIGLGLATKSFHKQGVGVEPDNVAIIPTDGVLDSNVGDPIIRPKEPNDVGDLVQVLNGKADGKAIILRGGYFGLELAAHLINKNYDVTLVCPEFPSLLKTDLPAWLGLFCEFKGIHVLKDVDVVGFEFDENGIMEGVKLSDRKVLKADVVFLGLCTRPITTFTTDEVSTGGFKMSSFFKTTTSNLYILADVISDKIPDFINTSAGKEESKMPTILHVGKANFLKLLEPIHNLVFVTGLNKRLSPDCYVKYISDLCAPMSRVLQEGPMALVIAPEDCLIEIIDMFGNGTCRASLLLEDWEVYGCDVVVSTISRIESNLGQVVDAFDSVCFVVMVTDPDSEVQPRRLLTLLSHLPDVRIMIISSFYTQVVAQVVNCSTREWGLALASWWAVEEAEGVESSGEEENQR